MSLGISTSGSGSGGVTATVGVSELPAFFEGSARLRALEGRARPRAVASRRKGGSMGWMDGRVNDDRGR